MTSASASGATQRLGSAFGIAARFCGVSPGARGTLESSLSESEPTRKLTIILSADAAEYSRMMRADEEGTFRALRICRQAIDRLVGDHQGRIFGTAGDSVIAEFASPVEALRCAVDIQQAIEKIDDGLPEGSRMRFRIGINLGDVMVEGTDLIGDGVNVAARMRWGMIRRRKSKPLCSSGVRNEPVWNLDDCAKALLSMATSQAAAGDWLDPRDTERVPVVLLPP